MPHRPYVARLGDRLWALSVVDRLPSRAWGKHQWGECDGSRRRIFINAKRSSMERWEALVHEIWHALNPEQDEDVVDERAAEMATILLEYGYRFVREARTQNGNQ